MMNVVCFDDVFKEIEKNDMQAMMNESYDDSLQEIQSDNICIDLIV